MNCSKCGAALPDDAVSCFVCGEDPRSTAEESSVNEGKPHEDIVNDENVQTVTKESNDVEKEQNREDEKAPEEKTDAIISDVSDDKIESQPEPEIKEEEAKAEPEVKEEEAKPEPEVKEEEAKPEPEVKEEEVKPEPEVKEEEAKPEPEVKEEEAIAEPEAKEEEAKPGSEAKEEEIKAEPEPEAKEEEAKPDPEVKKEEAKAEPEVKEEAKPEPEVKEAGTKPEEKVEEAKSEPKLDEVKQTPDASKPEDVNDTDEENHNNSKLLDEETKRKLGVQKFYREHVDYEAIMEAKRQKQDAILQKVVAIVVTVVIICVVGYVVINKVTKNKFTGYISAAEEAIRVKDYDKAFDELDSAKDVYKADENKIAMVRAAAYVSMGDYEKAMQVLLDTYRNNGENEEVYNSYSKYKSEYGSISGSPSPSATAAAASKTETYEELLASAKKLDDKTSLEDKIAAYRKAIEANPVKSEAYEEIVKLYTEAGNYDEAITLLNEGIVKCEASSEQEASKNKAQFESDVKKLTDLKNGGEYTKVCEAANKAYKDGDLNTVLAKYKEAVEIDKTKQEIYVIVSKAYIQECKYDDALNLLKDKISEFTKESYEKADLESAYKDCEEIIAKVDKYDKFYKQLYTAFVSQYERNSNNEILILATKSEFSEIASSAKVTYYLSDGTYPDSIKEGLGLAVYSNGYMYYGNWKDGKREGKGVYMAATKKDNTFSYYMYDGNWAADLPDGQGKVTCLSYKDNKVSAYSTTKGIYSKGYENGTMSMSKKEDGSEFGVLEYKVISGVPQALTNSKGEKQFTADGNIIIGYYLKNGRKNKVASVKEGTVWKVEGLK